MSAATFGPGKWIVVESAGAPGIGPGMTVEIVKTDGSWAYIKPNVGQMVSSPLSQTSVRSDGESVVVSDSANGFTITLKPFEEKADESSRCRRCGGGVDPAARRCPHCQGPGPGAPAMRGWRRVLRVVAWGAVALVVGAIALTFASAFAVDALCGEGAGGLCGDAEGAVYAMGMLVGLPAFLLAIPALLVAAAVEYSLNPAERGTPIVAAWDVSRDGESHLVSLPASRTSGPDHAWVDGQSVALRWAWALGTGSAALDCGNFSGTISAKLDAEGVVDLGIGLVSGTRGSTPTMRHALEVEGATVKAVPVANGERQT